VLLSQVVFNLVLNAVQAIEESKRNNGKIVIKTEIIRSIATIWVKDNGCGIPEEQKDKIFDAFHTTKYKNTGLGLSLAIQIIEQHQGKIEFKSKVGHGTEFIVSLPSR
jgi:signal transduction histidine kinase